MNQIYLYEINRKKNKPINFTFDQVKDMVIFRATQSFHYKERPNFIACLYCLGTVGDKYTYPVTLSQALNLLEKYPVVFNANTISELYRYIYLYDKDIYDKLNNRNEKRKLVV